MTTSLPHLLPLKIVTTHINNNNFFKSTQFSHKGDQGGTWCALPGYLRGGMILSPGNSLPSQPTNRRPESSASSNSGLQNKRQLCAFVWPTVCSSSVPLSWPLLYTNTSCNRLGPPCLPTLAASLPYMYRKGPPSPALQLQQRPEALQAFHRLCAVAEYHPRRSVLRMLKSALFCLGNIFAPMCLQCFLSRIKNVMWPSINIMRRQLVL